MEMKLLLKSTMIAAVMAVGTTTVNAAHIYLHDSAIRGKEIHPDICTMHPNVCHIKTTKGDFLTCTHEPGSLPCG